MDSEPIAKTGAVSVTAFGARGDGRADDAPAIQKALDSGGPVVVIPPGVYRIAATLRLRSNTTVLAHPEAVIRLAGGAGRRRDDFLLANSDPVAGNRHIVVRGGVWDGNNRHNIRGPDGDPQAYTGAALNFVNVEHLELSGLTVRNPDAFSIRLGQVRHFRVEEIVFSHSIIRGNQDGVHIGGFCEDGFLRNLRAVTPMTTNDDMVAINADDDVDRAINLGMKCGPIRNIHVEGLFAGSVYTFVRILSRNQPVENIRVRGVSGGVRRFALNMSRWRFPVGCGKIRNVHLSNFEVRKVGEEYLGDAGLRENGMVRKGDMLGYETPGGPHPAPHVAGVAHTAYLADPLLAIGLSVEDLVIENFRRAPDDAAAAPTLVLENARRNTIEWIAASPEQVRRAAADSRGLEAAVLRFPGPDGTDLRRLAGSTTPDATFRIARDGVDYLRLNPT